MDMPAAITEPSALPELAAFHEATRRWFAQVFDRPTPAQSKAWPAIARGENTLLLAPTGSGKTLAAFLTAIDRIMFAHPPAGEHGDAAEGVRTLYISPLKALGVDVERSWLLFGTAPKIRTTARGQIGWAGLGRR